MGKLRKIFNVLVTLSCLHVVQCVEKNLIVKTKQGKIEGELTSHGLYYEFLGVKYARAVKFRAPKEPPSFPDVFKANNRAVMCPQFPTASPLSLPSENEDCLVLNIYTPIGATLFNTTLPVLVFLHGGDFGVGSGSPIFYGPQYLVSHGTVVVTVNYRLNVYGFLNLGIKEAPGNAGLKDIRAALRWIQQNIAKFGGDPDNVTVFGQGSGGVAAIYLTLSKSTKGLFHRVISESGCLFTPESFDPNPLQTASQVAKSLELNSLDPKKLYKLFSERAIVDVEEAISKQMNPTSCFVPTIEKEFVGEEAFLTESPFAILAAGLKNPSFNPVPIVIGENTVEGLTKIIDYNTLSSLIERIKHEDYSALDQRSLIIPANEKEETRKMLKETYFTNTTTDEGYTGGMINMFTDFSYVGPMMLFSELYGNNSGQPLYKYVFNYIGNRNLGRILTNSSIAVTANQDELFYLFELERLPLPMDENDARMVTFMTTLWTNFAKHGTPTPDAESGEWLPYPYILAICLEPEYIAPLTPDRAYFWRSCYYKYGADIPKL